MSTVDSARHGPLPALVFLLFCPGGFVAGIGSRGAAAPVMPRLTEVVADIWTGGVERDEGIFLPVVEAVVIRIRTAGILILLNALIRLPFTFEAHIF